MGGILSRSGNERRNFNETREPKSELAETWDNLLSESYRLTTFKYWTNPHVDPVIAARVGFYHVFDDIVQCRFCPIELRRFTAGDCIIRDHSRYGRNVCPLIRGETTENIETIPGELRNLITVPSLEVEDDGWDSYPGSGPDILEPADNASEFNDIEAELDNNISSGTLDKPKHPEYADYEARLLSFGEVWPIQIQQKPEEIAAAGMYYTLRGDETKCFVCGLVLGAYEAGEDPLLVHALFNRECEFIIEKGGADLYERALKALPAKSSCIRTKEELDQQIKPGGDIIQQICAICLENPRNIIFLDCGHISTCEECLSKIEKFPLTCSICSQEVKKVCKFYIP